MPGVTSALAAAAQLGRSLTDRERAPRLQFVTLSDREGEMPQGLSWRALADPDATTALYMGARKLAKIVERLVAEGVDPATPAIYMENVSRPGALRIESPLAALPAGGCRAGDRGACARALRPRARRGPGTVKLFVFGLGYSALHFVRERADFETAGTVRSAGGGQPSAR